MVLKLLGHVILLLLIAALLYYIYIQLPPASLGGFSLPGVGLPQLNLSYPVVMPANNYVPQNQTIAYALSQINKDRNQYGLSNVTYSNITSGQQHSQSLLQINALSHWDQYGMKPYMRYTILGGRGSVSENVAFTYSSAGINVTQSIAKLEHDMMYNDLQCCNNGHRNNILTPEHNQVSIGVAYNRTTIFLTEDFIDNYIAWFYGTPLMTSSDGVQLKGTVASGYYLNNVLIAYDGPTQNMTRAQLKNTSDYSYGQTIAGVGYSSGGRSYYFPNIMTINSSVYATQKNNFDVEFNMQNAISKYGPGEYTLLIWLTNQSGSTRTNCYNDSYGVQRCNQFVGASYTIFINQNGAQYTPTNV